MLTKALMLAVVIFSASAKSQVPGAPGITPNWSVAKKVQVGTSFNKSSLVWFTNAQGVLTESYYPTIDKAQIKDAQILVSDGKSFMLEERTQGQQKVQRNSTSLVTLINSDLKNRFEIKHTFYTHQQHSVIIDEVIINTKIDGLKFYLLINPALNNTGFHDNGVAQKEKLVFHEGDTQLTVKTTAGFEKTSVGYVGFSDGFQDLHLDYSMDFLFPEALNGNIAGTGKINIPAQKGTYKFYITYSFEKNGLSYSEAQLAQQKNVYEKDWQQYFQKLSLPTKITQKEKELYFRSLYVLRTHEDKLNPGALIASLSNPWGDTTYEKPGVQVGGYHMVWPRDLYHVCSALINSGDVDTAKRALGFLKRIQYKRGTWIYGQRNIPRFGGFPQNVWVSGKEYWGGFQLDQTAYPVHIFYQLWLRASASERSQLLHDYGQMIKWALDLIKNYGPWTGQERWEENFGISPSTFSAAASALIIGNKIFHDDSYLQTANGWLTKPNDNIHTWTFTQTGSFDDGQYYLRVGGCSDHLAGWNPDNGQHCRVANSWSWIDQTKIIDQGFLKLALLGLVPAKDWRIKKSKEVIDNHIRVKTPHGYAWHRYSFDAYGEDKKGRLWPLLSGEHARYAIERFSEGDLSWKEAQKIAEETLSSYLGFANDGDMIPEQVWENSGEGTGSATPLAWSHAEYVKLLWSKEHKKNIENLLE